MSSWQTVSVDEDLLHDDRITLWGLFVETFGAIDRKLRDDLKCETPLPDAWLEVLLRIGRTPGQRVTMTQLARQVHFTSGGFTKLADRMEAECLVQREACPTDRRSFHVVLTDRGREILDRLVAVHLPSIETHLISHLTDTQRRQLEGILRTLRDAEAPEARP